MSKRVVIFATLVLLALTLAVVPPVLSRWAAGIHQQGVTRELARWEEDASHITTRDEASHAIDMMDYVQGYYVPGPGYRSTPRIESTLAAQRQKTLDSIARALETYSGQRFGTDVDRWRQWRAANSASQPAP